MSDNSHDGSTEPVTRDDNGEPGLGADGHWVRFLRDCWQGRTGEVRKLAAQVAAERVNAGDAEYIY